MPGRKAGSNNGEEDRKAEGSLRQAVRHAGIMGIRTGRQKEAEDERYSGMKVYW